MDHDAMLELAAADGTSAGVPYFRANRVVGRNPEVQGILIQARVKLVPPDHGWSMGFGRTDLPERARDGYLRSNRFRQTEGRTRVYLLLWFDIIVVAHDIEPVDAPFSTVFERQFGLGEIDGEPLAFPCEFLQVPRRDRGADQPVPCFLENVIGERFHRPMDALQAEHEDLPCWNNLEFSSCSDYRKNNS